MCMWWTSKSSPRPRQFRLLKSTIKTMPITFFDNQGVVHRVFVPKEQIVNSAFYIEVIGKLLKRISHLRPQFWVEGSCFLLHNDIPKHDVEKATLPVLLILNQQISFSLFFFKMKTTLEGKRFEDGEDIKKNVTTQLNTVPLEAFAEFWTIQQIYSSRHRLLWII